MGRRHSGVGVLELEIGHILREVGEASRAVRNKLRLVVVTCSVLPVKFTSEVRTGKPQADR